MHTDLDDYIESYNNRRPHRGRGIEGRTPFEVFEAGITAPAAARKKLPGNKVRPAAQNQPGRGRMSGEYRICTTCAPKNSVLP